jgi:alpha-1,2-mannosyltransferase
MSHAVHEIRAQTADAQPRAAESPSLRPSRWLIQGAPLLLALAVACYVAEFTRWPAYVTQIDAMVYRYGGHRVLQGLDLYSTGIFGSHRFLLFTYSPFAALCFTPLNLISLPWLRTLSLIDSAALLTYSVHRTLTAAGVPRRHGWWALSALLTGLALWSEPVRYSVQLGQINLVILAVVVADLLGPSNRKWAGVGIGLMAGIKLTPAIFLVYLLLIGRRRAAFVGASTFLATVALGFAILPRASTEYWFGGRFDDPQRVSPDPTVSSSVRGLFMRLHYPTTLGTAVAVALAMFCLAVAVAAWRRGHRVLGLSLVGLVGSAASPFSWTHHWIWFVPLLVHLGHRGYVLRSAKSAWAMWLLWALTAGWLISTRGRTPGSGLVAWRPGGLWNTLLPSGYVLVLLITAIGSALWLWRRRAAPGPPALCRVDTHADPLITGPATPFGSFGLCPALGMRGQTPRAFPVPGPSRSQSQASRHEAERAADRHLRHLDAATGGRRFEA